MDIGKEIGSVAQKQIWENVSIEVDGKVKWVVVYDLHNSMNNPIWNQIVTQIRLQIPTPIYNKCKNYEDR